MNRFGKLSAVIAGVSLVGALSTGVAHAAPAEVSSVTSGSASVDGVSTNGTQAVGGGLWSYTVTRDNVVSAFENHRFIHSTAVKSSGKTKSSGLVAKGRLASAVRPKALFGNQAFWGIY
ncbi:MULTISPECIES: lactococcin 972 family bacteriocin [unclassified Curtobacterium]|jgi:hypothetical protein|uniref:lactococcin 972 family bacteriocin n=1 Tax=unclassified Curtobacterium TaxID=257496 RepID=UPI000DA72866|nr:MULTISPECIES: lactococcin 972 family bacteriocin [unclassified Curtobacterium]QZQ56807.1 hypothetical protein KZI27_08395 [Curtobacterium sp. TC1]WIE73512.1 lactococcin 972 family bacteriocin [Curtobacterium sp. MCJR17_020]